MYFESREISITSEPMSNFSEIDIFFNSMYGHPSDCRFLGKRYEEKVTGYTSCSVAGLYSRELTIPVNRAVPDMQTVPVLGTG